MISSVIIGPAVALIVIATAVVTLRVISRLTIGPHLAFDDYTIILALVCNFSSILSLNIWKLPVLCIFH